MKINRFIQVTIFSIILSFYSCGGEIKIDAYDNYLSDNYKNYEGIRASFIDSLKQWKKDSLMSVSMVFFDDSWQVDSVLLFNRDSSRFYTTLNMSRKHNKGLSSELIKGITGAKINNKWSFVFEESRYISRKGYKTDIYSAMSFEELSYISHTGAMSRFLKVDKGGQYFIDYNEMDNYFFKAFGTLYPNIDKIDSVLLKRIAAYKKKKIDIKMIERVKAKRLNSVRPDEPETSNKSWWGRLFGKEEVGLFETEAWKNRRKE